MGEDLLWGTGGMEDQVTGDGTAPPLWSLGKYADRSREAACSGEYGWRLQRSPVSREDVVISPVHRQPVSPGARLTLTANVEKASDGGSLEIRWYRDFSGASSRTDSLDLQPHLSRDPCAPVSLSVRVPPGLVAAQPFVRSRPPHDVNLAAELRGDDLRLIQWAPAGVGGPRYDAVRFTRDGSALVRTTS